MIYSYLRDTIQRADHIARSLLALRHRGQLPGSPGSNRHDNKRNWQGVFEPHS